MVGCGGIHSLLMYGVHFLLFRIVEFLTVWRPVVMVSYHYCPWVGSVISL